MNTTASPLWNTNTKLGIFLFYVGVCLFSSYGDFEALVAGMHYLNFNDCLHDMHFIKVFSPNYKKYNI